MGISPEERAALGDPPTGHGLLGALITEARPLRIPDISADPRSVGFSRAGDVVQLAREAFSNVGRGFDVDMTSWGMGLGNLRERVGSLGGVLIVESTPGEGTTVRATFPS